MGQIPSRRDNFVRSPGEKLSKALSMATTIGVTMAVSTWVGYRIGVFLDDKLHSYPWFTFIFSLFGIGGGVKGLLRTLREIDEETK
jgi:F0F1-type ATP synthase assembly protein I